MIDVNLLKMLLDIGLEYKLSFFEMDNVGQNVVQNEQLIGLNESNRCESQIIKNTDVNKNSFLEAINWKWVLGGVALIGSSLLVYYYYDSIIYGLGYLVGSQHNNINANQIMAPALNVNNNVPTFQELFLDCDKALLKSWLQKLEAHNPGRFYGISDLSWLKDDPRYTQMGVERVLDSFTRPAGLGAYRGNGYVMAFNNGINSDVAHMIRDLGVRTANNQYGVEEIQRQHGNIMQMQQRKLYTLSVFWIILRLWTGIFF